MKIIRCGLKIKENHHVLVNKFHGNLCSKTVRCRKIKSVFRDVKWCFNASWRLKGLNIKHRPTAVIAYLKSQQLLLFVFAQCPKQTALIGNISSEQLLLFVLDRWTDEQMNTDTRHNNSTNPRYTRSSLAKYSLKCMSIINPLSPHDASKHHSASLKNQLISWVRFNYNKIVFQLPPNSSHLFTTTSRKIKK